MSGRFYKGFIAGMVISIFLLSSAQVVWAQVRSSTNYEIQSDSINIGGGLSSSTNYTQESTVGEIATGPSSSSNYSLKAGYQQMQEVYLSMTTPANVTMDTTITNTAGGTSNGTTSVVVLTDAPAGYSLTLTSESDPAMQSGANTIADYDEGVETDFTFSFAAAAAVFGFSPSGPDITSAFQDNSTNCNAGASDTYLACWAGLDTSGTIISQSSSANHPSGATTTIHFRVGIGSASSVAAGTYIATSTLTALPL